MCWALDVQSLLPFNMVHVFLLFQLRVWESDWLDPIRLTKWLWLCLIHGSKACLFVLLPMAVLYQESDGGCGRGNSFVRFMAVLLEVVLVGVVVFCIMAVLEVRVLFVWVFATDMCVCCARNSACAVQGFVLDGARLLNYVCFVFRSGRSMTTKRSRSLRP